MDGVDEALDRVVERVYRAFGARVSRSTVVATVGRCRRDLDIVSAPSLPELVERLATERLRHTLAAGT